jgi:hypothetical protein
LVSSLFAATRMDAIRVLITKFQNKKSIVIRSPNPSRSISLFIFKT